MVQGADPRRERRSADTAIPISPLHLQRLRIQRSLAVDRAVDENSARIPDLHALYDGPIDDVEFLRHDAAVEPEWAVR